MYNVSFRAYISFTVLMYVHLEDNRLRVRVMCRHAHACSTRIRIYNHYTFACLRYAYICTTRVVTEGSDCVGHRVRILGHTYLSICMYVCLKFMVHQVIPWYSTAKKGTQSRQFLKGSTGIVL